MAGIRTCRIHTRNTHVYTHSIRVCMCVHMCTHTQYTCVHQYKYARAVCTHTVHICMDTNVYSTYPCAHTFSNLLMYIRMGPSRRKGALGILYLHTHDIYNM